MENRIATVINVNGVNEIVTTTEEHAQELINDIMANNRKGVNLFVDNCEKLAELRATKGYLLLGYNSFYTDKDGKDSVVKYVLGDEISNGDTEAKNMCLLATTFGKKQYDDEGNSLDRWVIDERTKNIISYMSKGVLFELPALKECEETAQDIETLMYEVFGVEFNEDGCPIQKLPTVRAIREVKALERQFKLPYNEAQEAKAQLEAQAHEVAEDVAQRETEEPTEATEEPTEATEEPTEAQTMYEALEEVETASQYAERTLIDVTLKQAKQLLKVGYAVTLFNPETGETMHLNIIE